MRPPAEPGHPRPRVLHEVVDLWLRAPVGDGPERDEDCDIRVECSCGWRWAGECQLVMGHVRAHGIADEDVRRALSRWPAGGPHSGCG